MSRQAVEGARHAQRARQCTGVVLHAVTRCFCAAYFLCQIPAPYPRKLRHYKPPPPNMPSLGASSGSQHSQAGAAALVK